MARDARGTRGMRGNAGDASRPAVIGVAYDDHCFGCGRLNLDGLRMRFEPVDGVSMAEIELPERFQSWVGVVHGGIVSLMIDEAVGWAAWHSGHPGVTGRLEVRLRAPLRVRDSVRVTGRVDRVRRSLVHASAWIDRLPSGERVADGTATLMEAATSIQAPPG